MSSVQNQMCDYVSNQVQGNYGPCCAFIPSIHRNVNDEQMCMIVAYVGMVTRIDWVEMTPPKKNFRRAFVHFDHGNQSMLTSRNDVSGKQPDNILYSVVTNGVLQTYYATILAATTPVPRTELNIHQVAHNLKVLEESLWGSMNKKDEQIRDLEDVIEELQKQLANQLAVIRVLKSRTLFPSPLRLERQIAQSDIHVIPFPAMDDEHTGTVQSTQEETEIDEDSIIPDWMSLSQTTEDSLPSLIDINNQELVPTTDAVALDLDSVSQSTHDSMPSLIPDSQSTHDSMPPLIRINDLDSWDENDNLESNQSPVVWNSSIDFRDETVVF